MIGEMTKGLRNLKIKRDEIVFAVFNKSLQALKSSGEGAWAKLHKNHKYPFKFLRPFLGDGCRRTGEVQRAKETIWRFFQKKV
jgi:hypothetical protein